MAINLTNFAGGPKPVAQNDANGREAPLTALMAQDGSILNLSSDASGQLKIALSGGAAGGGNQGINSVASPGQSDGVSVGTYIGFNTNSGVYLFNGTSWDRQRGNVEEVLLSSAARVASIATADQTNYNSKGVALILNVTANPGGAENLSLSVEARVPGAAGYIQIYSGSVITGANGGKILIIYPGSVESPATEADVFVVGYNLPRIWRARVVHSGAGSWTYSLGCCYLV